MSAHMNLPQDPTLLRAFRFGQAAAQYGGNTARCPYNENEPALVSAWRNGFQQWQAALTADQP
jgi:hypothetical protein